MTDFVLSRLAESDLDDIWDYSAERWGREQANKYAGQLRESMTHVALDPSRGQSVMVGSGSYHRYRSGSHVIFYRRTKRGIRIVRILHQSMDHARHLR